MDPFGTRSAPASDQFASLGNSLDHPEGDKEGAGLKCAMKTYEYRYNSKGERVMLQVGMRRLESDKNWDLAFAFVLTRYYDKYQELEKTQLDIRSPYIKKALQDTIVRYPGVNFHAK